MVPVRFPHSESQMLLQESMIDLRDDNCIARAQPIARASRFRPDSGEPTAVFQNDALVLTLTCRPLTDDGALSGTAKSIWMTDPLLTFGELRRRPKPAS